MSERDPRRLDYATRESDRARDDLPVDSAAHASYMAGLLAPVTMFMLGLLAESMARVSAKLLGLILPTSAAIATAVTVALVIVAAMPVLGLVLGVMALRRMRVRPCRNRWQAFAGLAINAILCSVVVVMLYRSLR